MLKYILKRILLALFILFGVSLIIYFLIRLMPMDYIDNRFQAQINQGDLTQEAVDEMKAMYGLGDNSFLGILSGYGNWISNLLKGNWGLSFKYGLPVWTVIQENMWVSFQLAFIALILQYAIAIPLGIKAATRQYGVFDYSATVLAMIGISLPSFFFAALLIKIFSVDLGWFPNQGLITPGAGFTGWDLFLDKAWHLVLPMLVLVILSIGGLMRYTRTNTLEVLNSDYIRTARAKGLPEGKVIYKHAFRNTLIPLVTLLAGALPSLFGGAMITEQVFSIPGIGNMAYQALLVSDIPFIMGYNMFLALLTVTGTLVSDIAYSLVDPRVKLGR